MTGPTAGQRVHGHYPKISASAGSALRYPEGSTQPLLFPKV